MCYMVTNDYELLRRLAPDGLGQQQEKLYHLMDGWFLERETGARLPKSSAVTLGRVGVAENLASEMLLEGFIEQKEGDSFCLTETGRRLFYVGLSARIDEALNLARTLISKHCVLLRAEETDEKARQLAELQDKVFEYEQALEEPTPDNIYPLELQYTVRSTAWDEARKCWNELIFLQGEHGNVWSIDLDNDEIEKFEKAA